VAVDEGCRLRARQQQVGPAREAVAKPKLAHDCQQEACVCVLHGYYPQARNPDSSRNSCWIWNSLSSTDGSTMPPHPRADGPHHSSAETSLPRKPSVPESISSGGFEPTTSGVSRDPAPYLTSRPTTCMPPCMAAPPALRPPVATGWHPREGNNNNNNNSNNSGFDLTCYTLRHYTWRVPKYTGAVHHG
jgi:hypothetical protein